MLDAASGTLSDEQVLMAAVEAPSLVRALVNEFGTGAPDLLAAIKAHRNHSLLDDAYNLVLDNLLNCGTVLSTFTASQSFGPYDINIRGHDALCFVEAPEYGKVGPFPTIEAAEEYVVRNWADLLVSVLPTRSPAPAQRIGRMPHRQTRQARPKPQVSLAGRWYARQPDGRYFAHGTSVFCPDRWFASRPEFLQYLVDKHQLRELGEIREALVARRWNPEAAEFGRMSDQKLAAHRESADRGERAQLALLAPFFRGWLAAHASEHPSESQAFYCAARAWVIEQRVKKLGKDADNDEDVSVRRLHQHALRLVEMYRRHARK